MFCWLSLQLCSGAAQVVPVAQSVMKKVRALQAQAKDSTLITGGKGCEEKAENM